jgi:hypothetical protein
VVLVESDHARAHAARAEVDTVRASSARIDALARTEDQRRGDSSSGAGRARLLGGAFARFGAARADDLGEVLAVVALFFLVDLARAFALEQAVGLGRGDGGLQMRDGGPAARALAVLPSSCWSLRGCGRRRVRGPDRRR